MELGDVPIGRRTPATNVCVKLQFCFIQEEVDTNNQDTKRLEPKATKIVMTVPPSPTFNLQTNA